jgi:hypothetical protein
MAIFENFMNSAGCVSLEYRRFDLISPSQLEGVRDLSAEMNTASLSR